MMAHLLALLGISTGILGLIWPEFFNAAQRKEMGIQKVLGPSVRRILILLSEFYLRLVPIAFLIAIPLAN